MITLNETEDAWWKYFVLYHRAAAVNLITWAAELSELAKDKPVEWSDTWTDEDRADLQRASLANFDAREPEGS